MTAPEPTDVIVVGGGPGGSACAGFLAQGGMRVVLLERRTFPRDKVCGDCVNPAAWQVLDALGATARVTELAQTHLGGVEIIDQRDRACTVPWPASPRGEVAVRRALLDTALLEHALTLGAEVRQNSMVQGVTRTPAGWEVAVAGGGKLACRWLVAADGRNSTVTRLAGRMPAAIRDRLAMQTHVPAPAGFHDRVVLRLRPEGYVGYSRAGGDTLNLCLVSTSSQVATLRAWAEREFHIAPDHKWQSMAPLARHDAVPAQDQLLLVGDAARVVEPFTGEGIFYALRTGQLAAQCLLSGTAKASAEVMAAFAREHAQLYAGRLWINRLARTAVTSPRLGQAAFSLIRRYPGLLKYLTSKVVSLG